MFPLMMRLMGMTSLTALIAFSPDDGGAGDGGAGPAAGDGVADASAGAGDGAGDAGESGGGNAGAGAEAGDGEGEGGEDDAAAAEQARLDTVPEDGVYTLAMPEGVVLDEAMLSTFSPVFKDIGLTHNQAQALTNAFIEHGQADAKSKGEAWAKTVTGWEEQARADPQIGGDKWDATVASAVRAVNKLGSPELKAYLEASGGGNHPELIRIFSRVGEMIGDDDPANPENPGGSKAPSKDAASVLYPNDPPKGK